MSALPHRQSGSATMTADASHATASFAAPATSSWTAAWTTSPQRPGAGFAPNWSEWGFAHQTVRQVVRLSVGGDTVRVRLSNAYGTAPLTIAGATIALSTGGAAVRADSLRHLTVHGTQTFTVPAGAEYASDPVPFKTAGLEPVTVSLYLAAPTGPATYHAQAMATSYRCAGDQRAEADGTVFTETSQSWYYLSGLDVTGGPARPPGIVLFGDSLTDGTGSSPDANRRFPDALAERLAAAGRPRAVLNQGIGGNRVTVDSGWLGVSATSRFRRDVLGQPGVGTVVILLGINDIGISEVAEASPFPVFAPYTDVSADEIIAGYRDMIQQGRAAGLRVVGATVMPAKPSAFSTTRSEAKRTAINTWIRTSGEYDAVLDLDRALVSSSAPDRLKPAFDSGDHLHLNDTGYRAMADAVDLAALG
ncbi:SGNH/GDSL hydrolase family protein [Frankia sp. Mgl5]|uniref:SGNH/GDSL hydrolase family protein n=1 Tax=Frankia sp. Mgl5 TaxID=2933793 RepID=UPI00200C9E1C|nr:SGNH/GDSL hydrolase family protein [Frankia sp. Mgl5]MCK9928163.1 SGNH/GDSL hydrolase family protein [Frankia sp. Mgl5]